MPDISDVEKALAAQIVVALSLPDGYQLNTVAPSNVIPVKGLRVIRGWPSKALLDADLPAGVSVVSVFSLPNHAKLTTRYLPRWYEGDPVPPSLTVSVAGPAVTFGGSGGAGQVAGVRFGGLFDPVCQAYRLTDADTPASVAAALAGLIGDRASVSGDTLTIATNEPVIARVAADRVAWQETRRQTQIVCVDCWCPSPDDRDLVASAVDSGLSAIPDGAGGTSEYLALSNGPPAWVRYAGTAVDDAPRNARLWRRSLRYLVEYATTLLQAQPVVLFGITNLGDDADQTFTVIA